MNEDSFQTLRSLIRGEVITNTDAAYEQARQSFAHTGSPLAIVKVKDTKDVVQIVQFARDNTVELAVRSGGHGFNGLATPDGALVADLAELKAVQLDEDLYTVRIGAGARWGAVAEELGKYGLAISSGDTSSVGVGGLTLGGGMGWQVRNFGLAIDSLVAAEIVTADGQIRQLSATENPDLFWAIRGGGGNFGVVTSFTFRTHELKQVLKGLVMYPVSELESVVDKWAQAMRAAPSELNSTLVAIPGFGPKPEPMLMVMFCAGMPDEAAARKSAQPLLELGPVLHSDVTMIPYSHMLEEAKPLPGLKPAAQNGFVKKIDKPFIKLIAANYGRTDSPILQLRSLGGAMAEVAADETAFSFRSYEAVLWSVVQVPQEMSEADARKISKKSWQPIKPFVEGGYSNFLTDYSTESVREIYSVAAYRRLAEIKATYDPQNIFKHTFNISPAE